MNQHTDPNAMGDVLSAFDAANEVEFLDLEILAELEQNDLGNGKRLQSRFGEQLAFVEQKGWGVWDGTRWDFDGGNARALICAHETAQSIFDEAAALPRFTEPEPREDQPAVHAKWTDKKKIHEAKKRGLRKHALNSGNQGKAKAMLDAAAPYLRRPTEDFDTHAWLLNCQNGTLVLGDEATDGLVSCKKAERTDMLTHLATVDYDPDAPRERWDRFVREVLPDDDVRHFVQRWLGYTLTGDISEQRVLQFEGQGANGKSTLLEAVDAILGTYSVTTPIETFLHQDRGKSGSQASPDIARLPGARLVRTSEPEPGSRLSESMIKQWTGGEAMTCRQLHKDFFEFRPVGKLTFSVNIRPVIVGKDHGIKRRILVVPFTQRFPPGKGNKRGETLVDELLRERSGILNWLLDGFRMWWDDKLSPPPAVTLATDAYFSEMDPVGAFVGEACERAPDGATAQQIRDLYSIPATPFWRAYERWCAANNEDTKSQTAFGRRCSDMGIKAQTRGGVGFRIGVKLRDEWTDDGMGTPGLPADPMNGVL